MTSDTPLRITWAVAQFAPASRDSILEIGCGRGVAAALLCGRLKAGRYVGLDRSKVAIAAAKKRCTEYIRAGKAEFMPTPLADANFGRVRFDGVIAITSMHSGSAERRRSPLCDQC
jgi:methylase of polypeptide subunit release factors